MNRHNVKIYDYFYGQFLKQIKDTKFATNEFKSSVIEDILGTLEFDYQTSIRTCIHHAKIQNKSVWKSVDRSIMLRRFKSAERHMYYPENIAKAIPGYYDVTNFCTKKLILEEDFADVRLVRALRKAGLLYRCQLKKHLDNGWKFLWTIPGIGDGYKQEILGAIDQGYLD